MDFDTDLKLKAMEKALDIYTQIKKASSAPTQMITGETLKVYEELEAWQFLENFPINDDKNRWFYVTMIAMQQYRHLKWRKEHPPKINQKKTKWEVVHGKVKK